MPDCSPWRRASTSRCSSAISQGDRKDLDRRSNAHRPDLCLRAPRRPRRSDPDRSSRLRSVARPAGNDRPSQGAFAPAPRLPCLPPSPPRSHPLRLRLPGRGRRRVADGRRWGRHRDGHRARARGRLGRTGRIRPILADLPRRVRRRRLVRRRLGWRGRRLREFERRRSRSAVDSSRRFSPSSADPRSGSGPPSASTGSPSLAACRPTPRPNPGRARAFDLASHRPRRSRRVRTEAAKGCNAGVTQASATVRQARLSRMPGAQNTGGPIDRPSGRAGRRRGPATAG